MRVYILQFRYFNISVVYVGKMNILDTSYFTKNINTVFSHLQVNLHYMCLCLRWMYDNFHNVHFTTWLYFLQVNTCMLIKVIHVFLSLKANMNKKKKERIR